MNAKADAGSARGTHPVLAGVPLLIAHRGGAGLAPENTLAAFQLAAHDWGADMIELDVRATADGECVVIHDAAVDRTTDGAGAVAEMTLVALQQLDAGYRFTPDGGASFPFRGRGVRIPTFDEVLTALPRMRFTVEVKTGSAQRPLFAAIERRGATHRVIAAGMYDRDRSSFAQYRGPQSASSEQLRRFLVPYWLHLDRFAPLAVDAVQTCERHRGVRLVTRRFVQELHRRGVHVHVWTVNDPGDMHRLLDWGVDGIMSDYPDRLARVLHERVGRPLPPALR